METMDAFQTVRYVKNGRNGRWWKSARANGGQIHAGWSEISNQLLISPNFLEIERIIEQALRQSNLAAGKPFNSGVAKNDFHQVRSLLENPSRHLWITFEDGCLWWCTVRDGAVPNPDHESLEKGHFWLVCENPWSNRSLDHRLLAIADLPGIVTRTAGFKATVCVPSAEQEILRVVRGEVSALASEIASARSAYATVMEKGIHQLHWKDFELLVDLILTRTGWTRISSLGGSQKSVDLAAYNAGVGERAFVQVKASAGKAEFAKSVGEFNKQRELYARMIFVVHDPEAELTAPAEAPVHVWTASRLAELVVQVGLGAWIEGKLL